MTKGVLINAGRLDYENNRLNLAALDAALGEPLVRHDDHTPSPEDITARCQGHVVVISKEVPVDVPALPDTVKLICEAGTGFNNIDLEAAKAKGITVCNVPSYATDAVAHLVITFVLNFSSSIVRQHRALAKGDTSNFPSFTNFGTMPHFELGGKTIGLVGGTGAIGRKVGEIARVFGMKVLMWSRRYDTTDVYSFVRVYTLYSLFKMRGLHRARCINETCSLQSRHRQCGGDERWSKKQMDELTS